MRLMVSSALLEDNWEPKHPGGLYYDMKVRTTRQNVVSEMPKLNNVKFEMVEENDEFYVPIGYIENVTQEDYAALRDFIKNLKISIINRNNKVGVDNVI